MFCGYLNSNKGLIHLSTYPQISIYYSGCCGYVDVFWWRFFSFLLTLVLKQIQPTTEARNPHVNNLGISKTIFLSGTFEIGCRTLDAIQRQRKCRIVLIWTRYCRLNKDSINLGRKECQERMESQQTGTKNDLKQNVFKNLNYLEYLQNWEIMQVSLGTCFMAPAGPYLMWIRILALLEGWS